MNYNKGLGAYIQQLTIEENIDLNDLIDDLESITGYCITDLTEKIKSGKMKIVKVE